MNGSLVRQVITLPPDFSVTPEAEEARNELALRGRAVVAVTTAAEQASAVEVSRDLRSYVKKVESMRKTLTEPLLTAQRLLKGLADDHCGPLLSEQERIEQMVTVFRVEEERRVAEDEAKRRAEIERLERERAEAARKAREEMERLERERAEADRRSAEEAAKAKSFKQRIAFAAAEAERAAQEEARMMALSQAIADAERAEQASTAAIMAPLPEAQKARGAATKREMRVEVLDVHELYKSRPDLVRLEPNLAGIKATCSPDMPNVPAGLKLTWEYKTSTRAW